MKNRITSRAGRFVRGLAFIALACVAVACARNEGAKLRATTELDDYIAKPDPSYAWQLVNTLPGKGYTTYVLRLQSQTWRSEPEVNQPLWWHWLTIVKPDEVKSNKALLFIGGGSNKNPDEIPSRAQTMFSAPAVATKSIVCELSQTPNQPLIFNNDGQRRSEDDLIAYTWDKVMTTGDATWSARMPMVKGAIKAMDATQEFLKSPEGGGLAIDQFVVAGGSKRGWTTWLVGATDKRVAAIIPFVIDVLNVGKSMKHHHAAYGFWAPAVGDYVNHKITERTDTPEDKFLMSFEDPYSYRHRLTMPKYVVNAAGDQFFLPDSSQFYFDDLVGEKYLRYVPNTDHGLGGSDAPQSLQAFYNSILQGTPRPKFSWTKAEDGTLTVKCETQPKEVKLWQATNPEARDFRLETIGRAYTSTDLKPQADGTYVGKVDAPAKGFTAFFIEMTFDSGIAAPFKFTTEVSVLPDVLPFKDKPLAGSTTEAGEKK